MSLSLSVCVCAEQPLSGGDGTLTPKRSTTNLTTITQSVDVLVADAGNGTLVARASAAKFSYGSEMDIAIIGIFACHKHTHTQPLVWHISSDISRSRYFQLSNDRIFKAQTKMA